MRIIAGKYKRANLFPVPGNTSRPTTDYNKEVMFSILMNCEDKLVLDLFAGSGSLGFEALSRGAAEVFFVDFSMRSISTLKKNITKLKTAEQCRIQRRKVISFLKKTDRKFDLIFLDPPYNKDLVNPTLDVILERHLLEENGKIIVEHSPLEKIIKMENILVQKATKNTQISILGDENAKFNL